MKSKINLSKKSLVLGTLSHPTLYLQRIDQQMALYVYRLSGILLNKTIK